MQWASLEKTISHIFSICKIFTEKGKRARGGHERIVGKYDQGIDICI